MIKEAIEHVQKLARERTRAAVLTLEDGSKRSLLFNDAKDAYDWIEPWSARKAFTVSTVDSFAALVLADAARSGDASGKLGTVVFDGTGARYDSTWEDTRLADHRYTRKTTVAWEALCAITNKGLTQKQLVAQLTILRPFLSDATKVIRSYKSVDFSTKTNVQASPFLGADGKGGSSITVEFEATTGANQKGSAALPSELSFLVPYIPGGPSYAAAVEMFISSEGGKLTFFLSWPEHEAVESKAREEELERFTAAVKDKLADLTILRNF